MSAVIGRVLPPLVPGDRRKVVVLLNPHGGGGRAGSAWKKVLRQWLTAQGIPDNHVDLRVTERAGHAREIVSKLVLSDVLVLIVCGGDGFAHEAINGLFLNPATRRAPPNAPPFPVCMVAPLGSSNGLSMCLTGASDLKLALSPPLRNSTARWWPVSAIAKHTKQPPPRGAAKRASSDAALAALPGRLTPLLATLSYNRIAAAPYALGTVPPGPTTTSNPRLTDHTDIDNDPSEHLPSVSSPPPRREPPSNANNPLASPMDAPSPLSSGPPGTSPNPVLHASTLAVALHVSLGFIAMHDLYQEVRLRRWGTALRNVAAPLMAITRHAIVPARVRFIRASDVATAFVNEVRPSDSSRGCATWTDGAWPDGLEATDSEMAALEEGGGAAAHGHEDSAAGGDADGGRGCCDGARVGDVPPRARVVGSDGSIKVWELCGRFTALSLMRGAWPSSSDCLSPGQPTDGPLFTLMYTTSALTRRKMATLFSKVPEGSHTALHGGPAFIERVVWASVEPGMQCAFGDKGGAEDRAAADHAVRVVRAAAAAARRGHVSSFTTPPSPSSAEGTPSGMCMTVTPPVDVAATRVAPPVEAKESWPPVITVDGEVYPVPAKIEVVSAPATISFL